MNKTALVTRMAEKSGLNRKQAEDALDAFISTVTETLKAGDKVQLVGFGTFDVHHRAARSGRNPSNGEAIAIPASDCPSFKPGKSFKDEF